MPARLHPPPRHALAATATALFAASLAAAWWWARGEADGRLVSWLDDAYIHMAMARDVAEHGVFGVTPHAHSSSTSSPLWVWALAALYRVFGAADWIAFALAALGGAATLWVAARILTRDMGDAGSDPGSRPAWGAAGIAVVLAAAAPVVMAFSAMEHLAHAALMLAAVDALSRALAGPPAERAPVGLAAAFAALPLLRFESLWLVALGVALALARRRHALALALAVAALAPVAAFAAWSMSHGWWAVPFPILAKTIFLADPGAPSAVDVVKMLAWYPLKRLAVNAPALLLLLVAAVVALAAAWRRAGGSPGAAWRRWRDGTPVDAGTLALAIAALGIWAHATFGSFGWGGRYEVYLFALAGAFLPPALARARWPAARVSVASAAIAILASTTAAALTHRAYVMHADLRISTAVVWQRDFWPARYVARHHAGAGIVAMNIGALTWLSEPRLTDVLALGDLETARLLASRRLTADAVRGLATRRDARVAILFDGYFRQWTGGAPPFTKIATARPLAAAEMAVAIYAVRAADGAAIAATLAAFAREAPGGVALEWEPAFAPR